MKRITDFFESPHSLWNTALTVFWIVIIVWGFS